MTLEYVDALQQSDYESLRNDFIKAKENPRLASGTVATVGVQRDGKNLFIGYGFDLDENDADTIKSTFRSANISLTDAQEVALDDYKDGGSKTSFLAAWKSVRVDDESATLLLNVTLKTYEVALTKHLGSSDLAPSDERAALISQTYNLGVNGIPREISLLRQGASGDAASFFQRAEIFYEIAYDSTSLTANLPGTWRGLQLRRLAEASTFHLYSTNGAPKPSSSGTEAKIIFNFLDSHDAGNLLESYQTARKLTASEAKTVVDGDYAPAVAYLSDKFGAGQTFTDRHAIIVDKIGDYKLSSIPVARSKLDNLILAEDGDDRISAGEGNDVIYGGGGYDVISGGNGDDKIFDSGANLLNGGSGSDTYYVGVDHSGLLPIIHEDITDDTSWDAIVFRGNPINPVDLTKFNGIEQMTYSGGSPCDISLIDGSYTSGGYSYAAADNFKFGSTGGSVHLGGVFQSYLDQINIEVTCGRGKDSVIVDATATGLADANGDHSCILDIASFQSGIDKIDLSSFGAASLLLSGSTPSAVGKYAVYTPGNVNTDGLIEVLNYGKVTGFDHPVAVSQDINIYIASGFLSSGDIKI